LTTLLGDSGHEQLISERIFPNYYYNDLSKVKPGNSITIPFLITHPDVRISVLRRTREGNGKEFFEVLVKK
jgi:hypothetical protein